MKGVASPKEIEKRSRKRLRKDRVRGRDKTEIKWTVEERRSMVQAEELGPQLKKDYKNVRIYGNTRHKNAPSSPSKLDTLPSRHSTKWPTVILEGMA